MRFNKKSILLAISAVTLVGTLAAYISTEYSNGVSSLFTRVSGDPESYSLTLSEFDPYSSSDVATTNLGNDINFEYSNYSTVSGYWGSIGAGGYLCNTKAIDGLKSIQITFLTPNKDLTLTYGWYADDFVSSETNMNSLNQSFDFNDELPSFFKLENNTYDEIIITSIVLTYSCSRSVLPDAYNKLTFTSINGGTAYSVSGYASGIKNAAVPATHEGLPVTTIAYQAFWNCNTLVSVDLPSSVTTLENYAFANSSISKLTFTSNLTNIGSSVFQDCRSLTSFIIPSTWSSIPDSTFYGCTALSSVTIENGPTSIQGQAFRNCSNLLTLHIPASVTTIADRYYPFAGMASLQSITVDPSNPNFCSNNGILFNKSMTKLIKFPSMLDMEEYVMPNSITSISIYGVERLGRVESFTFNNNFTFLDARILANSSSLTTVVLPSGLTYINDYSFYNCTELTTITIPDGVQYINQYAFYHCESLVSINIPAGVTYIGISAFEGCYNLTNIEFAGTMSEWASISKGSEWKVGVPASIVHCSDGDTAIA